MLRTGLFFFLSLSAWDAAWSLTEGSLPNLVISGFTWAENLAFDGYGSLFVTENHRGELWRINLCRAGTAYCSVRQLSDGFSAFGGLQIPPEGKIVYAGATLEDGTTAVISTASVPENPPTYTIVSKTRRQPNGMACDWTTQTLYYTLEGNTTESGRLMSVDLKTGIESTLHTDMNGADGIWFDEPTNLLYVGLLTEKMVAVFNVSNPATAPSFLVGKFAALNSLGATHMLDDITLLKSTDASSLGHTMLLGADWLSSELQQFSLDGTQIQSIPPPPGIDKFYQLTSVRWGKGPGFDPNSVYVTEGGGMFDKQTNRRVIQVPMV